MAIKPPRKKDGSKPYTIHLDDDPVSQNAIEANWNDALPYSTRIASYIESLDVVVDEDDDQQDSLLHEMTDNLRYEEHVSYRGEEGYSEKFSCLLARVNFTTSNPDHHHDLIHIPLDENSDGKLPHIPDNPDVPFFVEKQRTHVETHGRHIRLAEATNELALCVGLEKGIQVLANFNMPTWISHDIDTLFEIETPPVYKLEIWTNTESSDELIEELKETFQDRCECLEISFWNEDIEDYEWFINNSRLEDIDEHEEEEEIIDNELEDLSEEEHHEPEGKNNAYDAGELETEDEGEDEDSEPKEDSDSPDSSKKTYTNEALTLQKKKTFADYLDTVEATRGYIVKESGVWQVIEDKQGNTQNVRIANSGIMAVALVRDEKQSEWMIQIVWVDRDKKFHEQVFPAESIRSTKDCLSVLESKGFSFPFGMDKYIKIYLNDSEPIARYRLIKKTGWYVGQNGSNQFALPFQLIGDSKEEEIYLHSDQAEQGIHQEGSFDNWQKNIAESASGNPIFIFCLAAAFASPLLKVVGGETGGFHIYGQTSRGKTTAIQISASVWGNGEAPTNSTKPCFINTWRATANSLEGIAAIRNDILLLLDELGQLDDVTDFQKVSYDLSSGTGKARMKYNASMAAKKTWRLIYISNGEISAKVRMEQSSAQAKGGQLLRLIDIDTADGIILDSHGETGADFADELKKQCSLNYGWAGPIFVEKLIDTLNEPTTHRELEETYAECSDFLSADDLEAEQQRVVKRFALVLLAGLYACKYGIIPLDPEEIRKAIKTICSKWLESADHLSDTQRAIQSIKDYIAANNSKFCDLESYDNPPAWLIGYKKVISGRKHYLFPTDAFIKAIKGSNKNAVLRKLHQLGLLHKNNQDKHQSRFNIPSYSGDNKGPKIPFYAISADILDAFEPEKPIRKVKAVWVNKKK